MTRVVDTREYLDVLRGLTEEGKEVSLLISGSSMAPFLIHARDYVYFRKPDRELKKGGYCFLSAGFRAVCHAPDLPGEGRRILPCGRRADAGGRADSQGSDLRPDLLCQKKGQKDSARRLLVGIFRPCVDRFSALCARF